MEQEKELKFKLCMEPPRVTHQQKKVARVGSGIRFYEDERLKNARKELELRLKPYSPIKPLEGAVQLITHWRFGTSNKKKHGHYKITRPDTDNMIKLLKDCMTKAGFWHDDSQVSVETTVKFWSLPFDEGIEIYVKELKENVKS